MHVMTVTGPVEADDLGLVLPHEHLLLDLRNQYTEPADPQKREFGEQPVDMAKLGVLRRNPYALKDNLLLDQVDLAVQEILHFKQAGGGSVVDCTSIGIKRNPEGLLQIAEATGLNIVAGCGYYTYDTHPSDMDQRSAKQITEEIVRELREGIDSTGIRAGVIGEIGVSNPVRPNETKNLAASAAASAETGAPIQIHTYMWGRTGLEAVSVLLENGARAEKIVVCHTDVTLDMEYILQLLDLGVYVEFDNFGKEFYIPLADRGFAGGTFAYDTERVAAIKSLVDKGYVRQLLISNDICIKIMLRAYGGWGYDHIITNIVPMMQDAGMSREIIDTIIYQNPKTWLCC